MIISLFANMNHVSIYRLMYESFEVRDIHDHFTRYKMHGHG